jgi:hypothetical protein
MFPSVDRSSPAELPRVLRIMPNGVFLRVGLAGSIALATVLGWLARDPHPLLAAALCWIGLGACVLGAAVCAVRLLLQLPVIEASELGIAIWFHGPFRRPFFAPWSRVRAVVLTQVRAANAAAGAGRDALGIELVQDNQFRLPERRGSDEMPVDGAARADLAWSSRFIGGNLRRWVQLLQRAKSAYTDPAG